MILKLTPVGTAGGKSLARSHEDWFADERIERIVHSVGSSGGKPNGLPF